MKIGALPGCRHRNIMISKSHVNLLLTLVILALIFLLFLDINLFFCFFTHTFYLCGILISKCFWRLSLMHITKTIEFFVCFLFLYN